MDKIERDGKVAVLYSPGYGAGWSTWGHPGQEEVLCMDAKIVSAFLDGGCDAAAKAATEIFTNFSAIGSEDLTVEWIEKGTLFEIAEYDGNESVRIIGETSFMKA